MLSLCVVILFHKSEKKTRY